MSDESAFDDESAGASVRELPNVFDVLSQLQTGAPLIAEWITHFISSGTEENVRAIEEKVMDRLRMRIASMDRKGIDSSDELLAILTSAIADVQLQASKGEGVPGKARTALFRFGGLAESAISKAVRWSLDAPRGDRRRLDRALEPWFQRLSHIVVEAVGSDIGAGTDMSSDDTHSAGAGVTNESKDESGNTDE